MTEQLPATSSAVALADPLGIYRPRAGAGASRQAWMVTFTDLIALMLTFFVLVFSMSSLDEVRWQNLADSLAEGLDSVREQKVPLTRETLNIDRVTHLPGKNLEYLYSLLTEHMRSSPSLAKREIIKAGDRLILRFAVADFFLPAAADQAGVFAENQRPVVPDLSPGGQGLIFALSGLLQSVEQRVSVIGFSPLGTTPADGSAAGSDWTNATAVALQVAEALRGAGYLGRLQVLGARRAETSSGTQVDIVIQDDRGEDTL